MLVILLCPGFLAKRFTWARSTKKQVCFAEFCMLILPLFVQTISMTGREHY